MPTIRLHLFCDKANASAMASMVRRLDGIKRVEAPDSWKPCGDADSMDETDESDPNDRVLEVQLRDRRATERALEYIEEAAVQLAVPFGFVVEP